MLQSFVATVMARSLTAHMIHFIIPAMKEHVSISSVVSAVMETNHNSHNLDILYCLLCIMERTIGVCVCVVNADKLLIEGLALKSHFGLFYCVFRFL